MNTELKKELNNETVNTDIAENVVSLNNIIAEYKAIAVKLSLFADLVPETPIEQKEIIEKEVCLLDKQVGLLESALLMPVANLNDAKAIMTLWHHEVVQSQTAESLSAADQLINSVFDFLKET
ncbi:hypothetical protein N9W89_08315 [Hellea sp.]|nr:hypothetical protein [Hellea sp.]